MLVYRKQSTGMQELSQLMQYLLEQIPLFL